jgi:hypothetical protein
MRSGWLLQTLALMGVLALPSSRAWAQPYSERSRVQVDVGIFYDGLAPYGDWVEMPDYGWSWAPRVDNGWRPYTRGQWVMTDDGWYWDSDEEFGWAAYHYGRWVDDPYYGWVWIPGTDWAPAWVSWRHGHGYTGWAPLPPRATWRERVGLSIGGLEIDAFIGARDYSFVADRAFVDRGIYQRILPPTQNVSIINETDNVTNYTVVNRRIVNGGIPVASVERAVGRGVPRARTVDVDRADAPRRARADEVAVFRPEVRSAPGNRPAQGRSLVKGEEPPSTLVVRRKEREQARQQNGNAPQVTARDVQQHRAGVGPRAKPEDPVVRPEPARPEVRAPQPQAQRPPERPRPQEPKATPPPRPEGKREQPHPAAAAPPPEAKAAPPRPAPRIEPKAPPPDPPRPRDQARPEADKPRPKAREEQPAKRGGDAPPPAVVKPPKDAPPQPKDKPKDKPKEKGKDDAKDRGNEKQ